VIDRGALARRLVGDNFQVAGPDLAIGGITMRTLAERFGTPFFVYDAAAIRSNYLRLVAAVGDFASIYFSIKANPNPAIVRLFNDLGAGLELASAGELAFALRSGGCPKRMLAAGPGKTRDDLRAFVRAGLAEIHLESLDEAEALSAIAGTAGVTQGVSLRINPVAAATGGAMRMGGKPTVFGFDEETMAETIAHVSALPNLDLQGVHLFAGTQILDAATLLTQWHHGLSVAARLAAILGRPLKSIDLGGGLGIPYHDGDGALDLAALNAGIPGLLAAKQLDPLIADSRIIIEPGRFLVGPFGLYVASVLTTKSSRGHHYVVTDGGMHHHLAASGNLGQVVKRDYPVVAASSMHVEESVQVTVSGPLCTPLDILARATALPPLAAGDLVAVLQSGAYGLTASPNGFLSHASPPEILVESGIAELIRPRIRPDAWLDLAN
jgi:diaminopimelate decarboxylase